MIRKQLLTLIPLILVVLSLLGILDASYLTYEKFAGQIVRCGNGWDCGKVLGSHWASIGPVPVSLIGILFYISVFLCSIMLFLDIEVKPLQNMLGLLPFMKSDSVWVSLLVLLTSAGLAGSIVFVGLMAFVIQAWCKFCVISAITSTTLFVLSYLQLAFQNARLQSK